MRGTYAQLVSARLLSLSGQPIDTLDPFIDGLTKGVRLLRLDPDGLRMASDLIPTGYAVNFAGERGEGLAGTIDAIRDRDDGTYERFRESVLRQFPHVRTLGFNKGEQNRKSVRIVLTDGTEVGAEQISEGLLYFMGFAALQYLKPVAMNLIEEPENGLYPPLIKAAVDSLRRSAIAQSGEEQGAKAPLLMATHSPLVINEMAAGEVTLITRDESGTRATRLEETKNYGERAKAFDNGELWLAYADGRAEAELVGGRS